MQRLIDWSEISFEKSEALNSQAMLENAKIIWLIRTFPFEKSEALDSQPMQRLFDWSEHSIWEIKGTGLTS